MPLACLGIGMTAEHPLGADSLQSAAIWHERLLRASVVDPISAEFEQWLSADPARVVAYARIEHTYVTARRSAGLPEMVALRQETLTRIALSRRRPQWRLAAAASLVAMMIGPLTFLAGHAEQDDHRIARRAAPVHRASLYQTAVGERLTVKLSDGSIAALNTASRLRVAYTAEQRHLVLEAGQALFEVAKGQTRPFVVIAGDRVVTAHGTAFDVRVERSMVEVALLEGEVTVVSKEARPIDRITRMTPNDVLVASGVTTSVKKVEDAKQIASWRDGLIIFENERLIDAIREVNRYVTRPIILADQRLESVRVSGAFKTGEVRAFVEALELGFSVRVAEETPLHIILVGKS